MTNAQVSLIAAVLTKVDPEDLDKQANEFLKWLNEKDAEQKDRPQCQHEWKLVQGMSIIPYSYCTKCGLRSDNYNISPLQTKDKE